MILAIAKMLANVVPNYPFAPEGNLTNIRKLTNITFAYQLSPTILQHFKQILIQGCIILAQIGPNLPIFPKRYILGKLTIAFVCLLCSILQQHFKKKKSQRANHQTRLHNFGPNWASPVEQKGIYWKS